MVWDGWYEMDEIPVFRYTCALKLIGSIPVLMLSPTTGVNLVDPRIMYKNGFCMISNFESTVLEADPYIICITYIRRAHDRFFILPELFTGTSWQR